MSNILILDDDFMLAKSWKSALLKQGHLVTISTSSSEAIAHCQHEKFDIFVVDLLIPTMDSKIKDSGQRFLVWLISTYGRHVTAQKAIGVSGLNPPYKERQISAVFGAYEVRHFLHKPFDTEQLTTLVEMKSRLEANSS